MPTVHALKHIAVLIAIPFDKVAHLFAVNVLILGGAGLRNAEIVVSESGNFKGKSAVHFQTQTTLGGTKQCVLATLHPCEQ